MSITEVAVTTVIERTGASLSLAEQTIQLANSNIETAVKLLKNRIIVITGSFCSDPRQVYGIFVVKLYLKNLFLKPKVVVFQNEPVYRDLAAERDWRSVEKNIADIELHYAPLEDFSREVNKHLSSAIDWEQKEFQASEPDEKKIERIVRDSIKKYLREKVADTAMLINFGYELVSQAELELDEISRNEENVTSASHYMSSAAARDDVMLKSEPLLNKESGRVVSALTVGDKIQIRITDTTPVASYVIHSVNAVCAAEKKTNCIPAIIMGLHEQDADRMAVDIEIIPGVFSKFLLDKDARVQLLTNPEESDSARRRKAFLATAGMAGIIILGLLIYHFFS